MTISERTLWSRLRGKQVGGIQFYRQKPIGSYIVDFYGPRDKLVIEIDGSQHLKKQAAEKDRVRDDFMENAGLKVLRFNSREVLVDTDAVVEMIHGEVLKRIKS
jgi:very-short-patch-repair endonuclease